MTRFERFFPIILQNEGSYVNDKNDHGGETKFGISKKSYPNLDIKNLTIEDAKKIYLRDYWNAVKGDSIINDRLSLHIFDMAVNAGVSRAIKMLQKVAGLDVDGVAGKNTINATSQQDIDLKYIKERKSYYISLNQTRFLMGWLRRVDKTNESYKKTI